MQGASPRVRHGKGVDTQSRTVVDGWGVADHPLRSGRSRAGPTVYRTADRQPDRGLWRVDGSGDYCSQWRDGAWPCYQGFMDGDGLIWVAPESGTRYPAILLSGEVTGFRGSRFCARIRRGGRGRALHDDFTGAIDQPYDRIGSTTVHAVPDGEQSLEISLAKALG